MNNKTPAGELSDEQIPHLVPTGDKTYDVEADMWWPSHTRDDEIRLCRAAIKADRALRLGDSGMPELPAAVKLCDPAWGYTARQVAEYAQAALAAKDVEISTQRLQIAVLNQMLGHALDAPDKDAEIFELEAQITVLKNSAER